MDSVCTAAGADRFKRALAARLADPRPVTLDAAAVQQIETVPLQLLVAFMRDRQAAGLEITWRATSAAFETAVELLGLGRLLGLPAGSAS